MRESKGGGAWAPDPLKIARAYIGAGQSVIPVALDDSKAPDWRWFRAWGGRRSLEGGRAAFITSLAGDRPAPITPNVEALARHTSPPSPGSCPVAPADPRGAWVAACMARLPCPGGERFRLILEDAHANDSWLYGQWRLRVTEGVRFSFTLGGAR